MHASTIFIWFIIYSVLGWIWETLFCSIKTLKWDNRGMLIGPYCPIYGVGAILDILVCTGIPNFFVVFWICLLGSAVLEYITSWTTERLFHAVWWDYSDMPLNLKGRVCLPGSLGFGAAGIVILYIIQPCITRISWGIPLVYQELSALLLMAVFAADCAITADSLIALNVKLEAAVTAIDTQIAERYASLVENTRQGLQDGFGSLKEKIPLEEFREHRVKEEIEKALSAMTRWQLRALRSAVSFPQSRYRELGSRMKRVLSARKQQSDVNTEEE